MEIIKPFLFSAIAAAGFAKYYNNKHRITLIATAISGGISFAIFTLFSLYGNDILGTFLAALLVGISGEFLSIRLKTPSTVFITPGIIPLVPGSGMYYTMLNFVDENFQEMINVGADTIFIAGSIAMGILVGSMFSRSLKRMRRSNMK